MLKLASLPFVALSIALMGFTVASTDCVFRVCSSNGGIVLVNGLDAWVFLSLPLPFGVALSVICGLMAHILRDVSKSGI